MLKKTLLILAVILFSISGTLANEQRQIPVNFDEINNTELQSSVLKELGQEIKELQIFKVQDNEYVYTTYKFNKEILTQEEIDFIVYYAAWHGTTGYRRTQELENNKESIKLMKSVLLNRGSSNDQEYKNHVENLFTEFTIVFEMYPERYQGYYTTKSYSTDPWSEHNDNYIILIDKNTKETLIFGERTYWSE